ncbi:MAG: bis(5'-nucleosyl)-tetraphosphatase (symmetrical) YqeK [Oscillospiraceae bacterium]|nr:bis(5'-nucleosyl)-tetraphosphatase (symmetrical) YqeK [Oscillospiraceae bacterium]
MTDIIEKYVELIRERLSEKRFAHSVKTAEMSRELAQKHGFDPEKAYLAGILHDICKEADEAELRRLANKEELDPLEQEVIKLWHAPAGAVYVRETLGIDDVELTSAIRFHTVGRANMTTLEKIIYLGDLVERSRSYPEVEKYREYGLRDLDNGMYEALKWSINDCLERKKQISFNTYEAYNYYLKKG